MMESGDTAASADAHTNEDLAADLGRLGLGSLAPLSGKYPGQEGAGSVDLQKDPARRIVAANNDQNRMLFFAKVLRPAAEDEIKDLFSAYGQVYDVNLFRAFQGAPTSKGCGLVTMGAHDEAAAAIEALHGKHTWPGMDSPMVVKWMDTALQQQRRAQHLSAVRQGLAPRPESWLNRNPQPHGMAMANPYTPIGVNLASPTGMAVNEPVPVGCANDALKLFVGNIPASFSEEQLLPFFETIGPVVELVIMKDKATNQSKGSAFVWYTTRAAAEQAILAFNMRHVLPDPTGASDRPLVVRIAKARTMQGAAAGQPPMMGQHGLQYQATAAPQLAMQQAPLQLASHSLSIGAVGGGAHGTLMHGGHTLYPNMSVAGQPGMMMMVQRPGMGAVQAAQPMPGAALIPHMAAAPGDAHMERGRGGQAQSERGQLEHGAISITVDAEQLAMVNSNMYNVQTMSGAQLNIMPLAQGMFQLVVSGSKAQVDHAKTLLSNVFTHGYGSTALQPTS
uniref:RRM domain-containing protein n=1 Tax=Chlamydomonas euryale TaxID=1486919 RepID=A0A7R9VPJ1_9CHLO|mmetsp:Transcript_40111/g.119453  ORF Transcript_40111/g.119453 Transcript_40111/m.119453 type:complete len:506 (+) Transcript_40111:363-1880(+)